LKKLSATAGCTFSCVPFTIPIVAFRLFAACVALEIHRALPGCS
jgi:hypothetical protein